LKFGERCVLDKKTKVKFGTTIHSREVFLFVFTLMFGVQSKLHHLEAIGTLLMISLGVIGLPHETRV